MWGWYILLATSFIIACAGILSIKASSPVHRRKSTLTVNSTLHTNKNQTLVTPDGVFELGFYSWRHTNDCQIVYSLAIWYAQIPSTKKTVVWKPNRTMNLSSNATLVSSQHGDLQVFDESRDFISGQPLWSRSTSSASNVSRGDQLLGSDRRLISSCQSMCISSYLMMLYRINSWQVNFEAVEDGLD